MKRTHAWKLKKQQLETKENLMSDLDKMVRNANRVHFTTMVLIPSPFNRPDHVIATDTNGHAWEWSRDSDRWERHYDFDHPSVKEPADG